MRIELQKVEPFVWRRLLVPGEPSLRLLHQMFQVAMGWKDYHLHRFTTDDGPCYIADAEDADEDDVFEDDVSIAEVLGVHHRLGYEYDFGDGWVHDVVVESESRDRDELEYAVCLEGENACPPEDVGGPAGYAAFLGRLADPESGDRGELMAQIGGVFDPAAFDVVGVNVRLQHVRW